MVASISTHHRIHRWLIFAGIWCIDIVRRNQKVVHFRSEHLLTRHRIFNIPASGSCAVLWIIVVLLGAIFDSEIGVTIEFLTSWTFLVTCKILCSFFIISYLVRNDAYWVNEHGEVLLEVGWTQDLELKWWNWSILGEFLKHVFSLDIVLNFQRFDDVCLLLLCLRIGGNYSSDTWLLISLSCIVSLLHLSIGIITWWSMRLTELTSIILIDGILLLIKLRARISTNPTN